jgi:hypothetical protein
MTIARLLQNSSPFATVSCDVFLQAGYGHGHLVRQGTFLGAHKSPQAKVSRFAPANQKIAHAITGFLELTFEPSTLRATDRIGRRGAHQAPVENVEKESSTEANKRQILFSLIFR